MDLSSHLFVLLSRLLSGESRADLPGLGRGALKEALRQRWQREIPRIARELRTRHVTLETAPPPVVVRDALFRLWRAVLPSGDLADFLRDAQDDRVLAAVLPGLTPETPTREVVARTATAALEIAF